MMVLHISGAVAVIIGAATMKLDASQRSTKIYRNFSLEGGHMLNIHRYVSECRGIDIDNPSIERSIEPFMMFQSLAYMTANDIHSNMVC